MTFSARVKMRHLMLAVLLGACVNLSGCIVIYSKDTVQVSVRDAETNSPISNAKVQAYYWSPIWINIPDDVIAHTDNGGSATLRVANCDSQGWNVSADGYLLYQSGLHDHARQRIEFRLFQGPKPSVTIVVPNGYHGLVKVDWRPVPAEPPDEIGKREFTFRMSPTGHVSINVTPLLNTFGFYDIKAAYENGGEIPHLDWDSPDDSIDRWGLVVSHGDADQHMIFIVGTTKEEHALIDRIWNGINPTDTSLADMKTEELFNEASTEPTTTARP